MSTKRELYINALYFDLGTLQEALRNMENDSEPHLERIKMIESELSMIEHDKDYEPWDHAENDRKQFEKDHYSDLY